jgi:hypothetical protein
MPIVPAVPWVNKLIVDGLHDSIIISLSKMISQYTPAAKNINPDILFTFLYKKNKQVPIIINNGAQK